MPEARVATRPSSPSASRLRLAEQSLGPQDQHENEDAVYEQRTVIGAGEGEPVGLDAAKREFTRDAAEQIAEAAQHDDDERRDAVAEAHDGRDRLHHADQHSAHACEAEAEAEAHNIDARKIDSDDR